MAAPVSYDFTHNWLPLPSAGECNYFALASQYDVYQWGLTENYNNLSTPKYEAVAALLARDSPVA